MKNIARIPTNDLLGYDVILDSQILLQNSDLNFSDILVSSDLPLRKKTVALLELARVQTNSKILEALSYSPISPQTIASPVLFKSFNQFLFNQEEMGLVDSKSTSLTNTKTLASSFVNTSLAKDHRGFDFEVTVVDQVGNTDQEVLDLFKTLSELALGAWAEHIQGASGASLEVQVNVGGTTAVASAGPGDLFFNDFQDLNNNNVFDAGDLGLIIAGSLLELQTGSDPNDNSPKDNKPDIIINVNPDLIGSGDFFFDPELNDPVPKDAIDFYSVILHEVAHGLGFFGLAGELPVANDLPFGNFLGFGNITVATRFDLLINDIDIPPRFVGPNSVNIYGSGVPLEFTIGSRGSDLAHFLGNTANEFDIDVDLSLALMNPFVIRGDRLEIGALELALLKDIGHTIIEKPDVPFINTFDRLPDSDVPIVTVGGLSGINRSSLSLGIELSSIVPIILPSRPIASSVGIEITTSMNAELGGRVLFSPDSFGSNVNLSLKDVFGVSDLSKVNAGDSLSASLKVRLFNPAQAVLEGAKIGSVSETFTTVDLTLGRGTNNRDKFFGKISDDIFLAGNNADKLFGNSGNDLLFGEDGNDNLFGGNDDDILIGGDGKDNLDGGLGNDILLGGKGKNKLFGGDGNDILIGDSSKDTIYGGFGDDLLVGITGKDKLYGGFGSDIFIFGNGDGKDTIFDFQVGKDKIGLVEGELTFNDLTITQQGKKTVIGVSSTNENLAVLKFVNASSLTANDFMILPEIASIVEAVDIH